MAKASALHCSTDFFKKRPVLVTGGAGFIGSHLVEHLVELQARVTVLDNLSTGSLDNLTLVKKAITFLHGDITNFSDCSAATKNQEIVFHLAAHISVPDSLENPQACYQTNVIGTQNMLQAAWHNKAKKFIFSSSAAVYGPQEGPCTETALCKPESPYGHSKLIGELLCTRFAHESGLQTTCLRYFNVFGERQNPNNTYAGVVTRFKTCMQANKPITIFGDGTQTRDFIEVQHVVEANCVIAKSNTNDGHEILNVATGTSITLLELIETLKNEFPTYSQEPIFKPARHGDIQKSQADCTRFASKRFNDL